MSKDAGTETSVVCSVAPMLSVRNGARAVEFYKSAFGSLTGESAGRLANQMVHKADLVNHKQSKAQAE